MTYEIDVIIPSYNEEADKQELLKNFKNFFLNYLANRVTINATPEQGDYLCRVNQQHIMPDNYDPTKYQETYYEFNNSASPNSKMVIYSDNEAPSPETGYTVYPIRIREIFTDLTFKNITFKGHFVLTMAKSPSEGDNHVGDFKTFIFENCTFLTDVFVGNNGDESEYFNKNLVFINCDFKDCRLLNFGEDNRHVATEGEDPNKNEGKALSTILTGLSITLQDCLISTHTEIVKPPKNIEFNSFRIKTI